MQMIVHQILTMATLCYLVSDKRMFEQKGQAFIEISSEFLLLFVSLVIQESIREHDEEKLYKIGTGIFVGIGLMTAVNVTYIIYTVIQGCREKRRLKALEKRKKEAQEKAKKYASAAGQKKEKNAPAPVLKQKLEIIKEEEDDESYQSSSSSSEIDEKISMAKIETKMRVDRKILLQNKQRRR